jgi:hypothetical protein
MTFKTQVTGCPHMSSDKCEACWAKRRKFIELSSIPDREDQLCWERRLYAAKYYEGK